MIIFITFGMLHNSYEKGALKPIHLWPLLLLLLAVPVAPNNISMTVSATNLQINQISSYTFVINRQYDPVNYAVITSVTAVPLNSYITIKFPSPPFLTVSTTTTVACTDSNGNDMGCTLNPSTFLVTIANYYTSTTTLASTSITIIMPSITNANKAGPCGNFEWGIYSPNGTVIDSGPLASTNYLSTSLTFTGGNFQCTPAPTQPAPSPPATPTSATTPPSPSPSYPPTRYPRAD